MKYQLALVGASLVGLSVSADSRAHYLSSVQMVVQERNAALTQRAQRLVMDQFTSAISASPALQNRRFESHMNGNEVVLTMSSDADLRMPVQEVLASIIQGLNGRVLARGRSQFYRAAL